MLDRAAEEVRKDNAHYKQREQRVQNAPRHTEHRALILRDKVTLYQLFQ